MGLSNHDVKGKSRRKCARHHCKLLNLVDSFTLREPNQSRCRVEYACALPPRPNRLPSPSSPSSSISIETAMAGLLLRGYKFGSRVLGRLRVFRRVDDCWPSFSRPTAAAPSATTFPRSRPIAGIFRGSKRTSCPNLSFEKAKPASWGQAREQHKISSHNRSGRRSFP